ncbi:MAG: DNA mismatch repair protein MutS [Tissierellia bacterium]|nr:DNA mismatch repair protein MutS [Tissierellia bacterium]
MEFFHDLEREAIDLQYVLNFLKPVTPYGNLYKSRMGIEKSTDLLREEFSKQEAYFKVFEDIEEVRFSKLVHKISEVKDLRNSFKRAMDGFVLTDVELFEVKNYLSVVRQLERFYKDLGLPFYEEVGPRAMPELEEELDPEGSGVMTFYIYDSYSENLAEIRKKRNSLEAERRKIVAGIKDKILEEFELRVSPDGALHVAKDDPRLDEIKASDLLNYSKENFRTVEFKLQKSEGQNLIELEIDALKKREEAEEERIREDLSKKIGKCYIDLYKNAFKIGQLDLYIAKFFYRKAIDGVKPSISDEHIIEIEEGFYPLLRDSLRKEGKDFTPITVSVGQGTTVITGANMGGKSVSLKLIGLVQTLAQIGLYVPCKSAKVGVSNFFRASVGDLQSTETGLSTFGAEINRIAEAIDIADEGGLLLIDELARGTNPEEGRAITGAVCEYLNSKNTITVMTTHYDEISDRASRHYQVTGLSKANFERLEGIRTIEDKLEFINENMDYRLFRADKGRAIPKDALNIASIMGLKKEIIDMATEDYHKEVME